MDSWQGTAELEWWANRSTCMGRFGVRLTVHVAGSDWTCEALLDPPLSGEHQEVFDFLTAFDQAFTLRLDEGGTMLVDVSPTPDRGRLTLTAFEAPVEPVGTRRIPEEHR